MTARSLILGALFGTLLAATTYYNDQVIRQTYLIGNHLPASVFGFVLLLLLAIVPALAAIGLIKPFRPQEVGLITAMALMVCTWPGSGLFRVFTQLFTIPAIRLPIQTNWNATEILAYVPGGSPRVAEGYVTDWRTLARTLRQAAGTDTDSATGRPDQPLRDAVASLPPELRAPLAQLDPTRPQRSGERSLVIRSLNALITGPSLLWILPASEHDHRHGSGIHPRLAELIDTARRRSLSEYESELLNRLLLVHRLPDALAPPPPGDGVLLNHGRPDPAITPLLSKGLPLGETLMPWHLPWARWWPVLRLWGGVALLTALATFCMILIVHPQWSRRELLPYPTAQFIHDAARRSDHGLLPDITRDRLFWIGLAGVFLIHLSGGFKAWFPGFPAAIPVRYSFEPLVELFPDAARINGSGDLFAPTLYFSVIGFGYFINARTTCSLGLSLPLWVFLGTLLMGYGVTLDNSRYNFQSNGTAMRLGAYLASGLIILYFGRRYYLGLMLAIVPGVGRADPTLCPPASVTAGRVILLAVAGAVALLWHYADLSPWLGATVVLSTMLISLVLARLNAETGLFYAQPDFMPVIILFGILGLERIGPEALIVTGIASLVLVGDPREILGPYVVNALRLTDPTLPHTQPTGPRLRPTTSRAMVLLAMLLLGFFAALTATFTLQHNLGLSSDGWPIALITGILGLASSVVTQLAASGQLEQSMNVTGIGHLTRPDPTSVAAGCLTIGFALVLIASLARIRFARWPIHPALFVVWGTYPMNKFAVSFLFASLVKFAIVRLSGEQGYHRAKPLMIGLIAGEVLAILLGSIVGALYYQSTGLTPSTYRILPG